MTTEEAQKEAIADLDRALGEALQREHVARQVAEDLQAAGQSVERKLVAAHQLADALRTRAEEAEGREASYRRQFDDLKKLYLATANDRDLMARRAACAEMELEMFKQSREGWRRWLPWT